MIGVPGIGAAIRRLTRSGPDLECGRPSRTCEKGTDSLFRKRCSTIDQEFASAKNVSVPLFTRARRQAGFTLLEVLVASLIMGIAVSGILSGLAAASRNASRLTAYDRATLLARQKMDELLADQKAPRNVPLQGTFDPAQIGGATAGWRARIAVFEAAPGASAGRWCVDRVALEIWWLDGQVNHSFSLEGFRRSIVQPGDRLPGSQPGNAELGSVSR